jgi:TolA-binding protein
VSATKWIPADDELDGLARSMPVAGRARDRIEHERTSLLAQAAGTTQQRRGSRTPLIAGAAVAFAAAAAVILWLVARPGAPEHARESITALGPAQYERIATWPDFKVKLEDGRIDVRLSKLPGGDRFRVVTADAEVEVRGTQFVVGADHGSIASVSVGEGRVEVRWMHEQPVFLSAGQTWSPTRTAQRDEGQLAPPAQQTSDTIAVANVDVQAPNVADQSPASAKVVATPTRNQGVTKSPDNVGNKSAGTSTQGTMSRGVKATHTKASDTKPTAVAETKIQTADAKPVTTKQDTSKPLPLAPGEADFRAGISSLRAGDATTAVTSFSSACMAAEKEALGEDACFWLGAAAKRAGQSSTAREALTRFLKTFPSSARAGEASALLGWLLYDAGELDDAQQRFELAARDRVPKVKESAERGLEAIKRKRGTP